MFGIRTQRSKGGKEEAEKPFWISFSDLMTALMVLFLVSMAVALMAVTQKIADSDKKGQSREETIDSCMTDIKSLTKDKDFEEIAIRDHAIDFGKPVLFEHGQHTLSPQQEYLIRSFVPKVLEVARRRSCDQWLKRVVVEGFASERGGTYLENLNLSYLRSQRVLCVLLNRQAQNSLSLEDRAQVRALFHPGGSSFNTASASEERMRRVELTLEFRDLDAKKEPTREIPDEYAVCPNDLYVRRLPE